VTECFFSEKKDIVKKIAYNMEQTEQAARLNTQEEFIAWEHRCDEFIELLEEQNEAETSSQT